MGGKALYEETMDCAKWMNDAPDKGSSTMTHRIICDVARCYYRQVLLHLSGRADPATGHKPVIVRRSAPESFIFSTKDLVKMLLELPEGGWRSYGKEKKVLNDHGLYELLESYGLESVHRRVGPYKFVRGLTYNLFHEKYGRHCRVGDPTLKSISDELEKEFEPPDDPSDSSGVSPDTPSPDPTTGDNKGEGAKNTKSGGTSGTQGLSPLFSTPYVMSFITEQDKIKTRLDTRK